MKLAWHLEAWLVRLAIMCLRAIGPVRASNLAGALARCIGPLLPVSGIADANLRLALLELDPAARRRVVRAVWDNLGRTLGELPHLSRLRQTAHGPGWEIAGADILHQAAVRGGPHILMSGHIGNWEILPPICLAHGIALSSAYRAAANPLVQAILDRLRTRALGRSLPMFPKGAAGARAAMAHLKAGGCLGLLMDQKLNDGVAVPFFGHPAMTAPSLAALALRYRCPVIPGYIQRLGPARLRLVVEPPLSLPDSGDRHADILALTGTVNMALERWIRADPGSWLWLHRRWPKAATASRAAG